MSDFILEIGSEELPARFLPDQEKELRERMHAALSMAAVDFSAIEVECSPRRAMVLVRGIALIQRETEEVLTGPPAKVSFDAEGKPLPAAEGFVRTQGVNMADTFLLDTDKGKYLAVRKKTGGGKTADILAGICPELVASLPFPKRMRWGSGDFLYARPLRWLVALLDDQVIPFSVAGVDSGRHTYGHRVHSAGRLEVPAATDYLRIIRDGGQVILSAAERRSHIMAEAEKLAKTVDGDVVWKDSLLTEVQGLTEHPVPVLASMATKYLELPREVLLTSMETHQKCFGVEGQDGELLPYFITVLNMTPPDLKTVQAGWERVLTARLEDANFFWKTDLTAGLDAWAKRLDDVIFLAPLGSMGDKCRRLEKLCAWLAKQVKYPQHEEMARAGRLAKADLCSGMVGEFGSLQGIMGSIYARHSGEHQTVVQALREQYLPAGPDTPAPETLAGAILSMADKADTMMGCFGLNMIPTGAADPYALRRCALGILRIALKYDMRFDLAELFAEAQDLYTGINWKLPPDEALAKVMDFTALRAKNYFTTNKGYDVLISEAALAAGLEDICSAALRVEALAAFSRQPNYEQAVHTFKRLANIIAKIEGADLEHLNGGYSCELLREEAEKNLAAKLEEIGPRFDALWHEDRFPELFGLLDEVRPAVDAFFEQVMVMDKDDAVRRNRLNILQALAGRLGMLADFKALQI